MLEGRCQQSTEEGQRPVCFAQFPGSDLEEHCRTHFTSPEPAESSDLADDDKHTLCPLGCGQKIRLADLASHEMLHRCYCALISWEALTADHLPGVFVYLLGMF